MRRLLRSVWNEPVPAEPPRRSWRDWALVGIVVAATILEGLLRPNLPARVVTVVLMVALASTLLWRRTRPLLMLAIGFGAGTIESLAIGAEPKLFTTAFLLLLPYALFRWGSGQAILGGVALIIGKSLTSIAAGHLGLGDAVGSFVVLGSTYALAMALRYRATARHRELDQVRLLERERLARDLHDTVAHHVSAMAIRAQAGLARAATEPNAATDALRLIESEASRALAEMRAMVRYLRVDQPAELSPSPRIADLRQLAGRPRTGPWIEVEFVGDVGAVPASMGAAVYRLVQESITNARRHARRATRIAVLVAAEDGAVRLRVSDDGEPVPAVPTASGFGLVGMAERARLLGGTCEAGPSPDRGWTVVAVLPRTGAAR